jgi:ABC-type multidrug transport system fused ATPase/permease subunit
MARIISAFGSRSVHRLGWQVSSVTTARTIIQGKQRTQHRSMSFLNRPSFDFIHILTPSARQFNDITMQARRTFASNTNPPSKIDTTTAHNQSKEQQSDPGAEGYDQQSDEDVSFKENLLRFARIARPEFGMLGLAIVFLFVSSAVSMSVPLSIGTVIDIVMESSSSAVTTGKDVQGDNKGGLKIHKETETQELSSKASLTVEKETEPPKASSNKNSEVKAGIEIPQVSGLRERIKSIGSLETILGVFVGIFVVGSIANTARAILMKSASERIITRLRNQLYSRLVRQDVAFHDMNRTGDLISRLSTDTVIVSRSLTNNVSDGLRALVMSSVGVSAMIYVNLSLTLTMMMIVPPVSIGAVYYGKYLRNISKHTTDAAAKLTRIAEEKISNIRTVRAFSQEPQEIVRYNAQAHEVYKYGMKEAYASGFFFGAAGLSGNLIILAILYYGGTMVQSGAITVGDLTSFFLYTAYVGSSLMGLSNWYAELNKGVGASARLFALLETRSTIESTGTCADFRRTKTKEYTGWNTV